MSGCLFVLDSQVVYRIDPVRKLVRVVAGIQKACEHRSPHSSTAQPLKHASAIAVDSTTGMLFIAESDNKRINQVGTW